MTSYVESATLKVIDEASAPIEKIDASLRKLMKTAGAFAKATEKFGKAKTLEPVTRQVRELRREFEALGRVSGRVARGTASVSSGGVGSIGTSAARARREVRQLGTEMRQIGNRRFGFGTAGRGDLLPLAQIRAVGRELRSITGRLGFDIANQARQATSAQVRAAQQGARAIEEAHRRAAQAAQGRGGFDVAPIAERLSQAHIRAAQAGVDTYRRGLEQVDSARRRLQETQAQRQPGQPTAAERYWNRRQSRAPTAAAPADVGTSIPLGQRLSADAIAHAISALTPHQAGQGSQAGGGLADALVTDSVVAAATRRTVNAADRLAQSDAKMIAAQERRQIADTKLQAAEQAALHARELAARAAQRAAAGTAADAREATRLEKSAQKAEMDRAKASAARDKAHATETLASISRVGAQRRATAAANGAPPAAPPRGPSGGSTGGMFGPGSILRRGADYAGVYAGATAIGATARTAGAGIVEGSTQRTLTDILNLDPQTKARLYAEAEAKSLDYRMLTKSGLVEIGRDAIGNLKDGSESGAVMEHMAKAAQVMALSYGDPQKGLEAARQFYRAADIMGRADTASDVGIVMEAFARQQVASGKDINARSVAQAVANLGGAKFGMGSEMIGDLVSLSDEVRGQTASYIRTFHGDLTRSNLDKNNKAAMEGAGLRVEGGGASKADLLQRDTFEYVMQEIKPRLAAMGVDLNDTNDARKAANINAGLMKLGFLASSARYASQAIMKEDEIRRDRAKRQRVDYSDGRVKGLTREDVKSSMESASSAWKDAWDSATKPLQKPFAKLLGDVSGWIKQNSTEANVGAMRWAALGVAGAGAVGTAIWNNKVEAAQLAAAAALGRAGIALTAAAAAQRAAAVAGGAGALGGAATGTIIGRAAAIAFRAGVIGALGYGLWSIGDANERRDAQLGITPDMSQEEIERRRRAFNKARREGRAEITEDGIIRNPQFDNPDLGHGVYGPRDMRHDRANLGHGVYGPQVPRDLIQRDTRHDNPDLGHGMIGPPAPDKPGLLRWIWESIIGSARAEGAISGGPNALASAEATQAAGPAGESIRSTFETLGSQVAAAGEALSAALTATGETVMAAGGSAAGAVEAAGGSLAGAIEGLAGRIGSISIPNPSIGGPNVGTNQGLVR